MLTRPPTYRFVAAAPRLSIQMIASASGSPVASTGTVPDHCDVTDTATIDAGSTAPRALTSAAPSTIAFHQSAGRCSTMPFGPSSNSTGRNAPSTYSPSIVNSATFGPDVPRSIVKTCSVIGVGARAAAQTTCTHTFEPRQNQSRALWSTYKSPRMPPWLGCVVLPPGTRLI